MADTRLIDREDELEGLTAELAAAEQGQPGFVLIRGEAGVGKSRVLEAFTARVCDRSTVLVGRCVDVGHEGLPFVPVSEVLRQLVRGLDAERLAAVLGPSRTELTRLVPQVSSEQVVPAEPMPLGTQATLFSAVLDAFQRFATEQPLVVAFEDLHWADPSTLSLLRYLAANLGDARLLVIGTMRSDELGPRHPRRRPLGELARVSGVKQFHLEPLSRAEVAAQIATLVENEPDPALVDEIATRTEGNPFFVEELLAEYREHGQGALSETLRNVLLAPLGSLPEQTRHLAELVAAAGRPVSPRLLETITGLLGRELADALRPAVDRYLLVESDDGRYAFRHALSQEAVYAELLATERTPLHRRIAEALSSSDGPASEDDGNLAAELAHHWEAAQVYTEAFRATLDAAERSQQMGAHAAGLRHYERALSLWGHAPDETSPSRSEVHAAAADAAHRAGDYDREARHLRAALATGGPGGAPREAELRRRYSLALYRSGDGDGAMREIQHVLALEDDDLPAEQHATALAWYARGVATLVGLDAAEAPAQDALEAARSAGARHPESIALMLLGGRMVADGRQTEGIDSLERAREIAEQEGDTDLLTWAYHDLLAALVTAERHEESEALLWHALAWLDAGADREAASAYVASRLAWQLLTVGNWQKATQVLQRAARHELSGPHHIALQEIQALMHLYQGRSAAAAAKLKEARDAGATQDRQLRRPWYELDALAGALTGDVERVRDACDAALAADASWQVDAHPLVHLTRTQIDAALRSSTRRRAKRLEAARESVERLQRSASTSRGTITRPWGLARDVARAQAELSRATDHDRVVWRELLSSERHAYWRVYDRWRLAEALLASNTSGEARTEIEQGHREAETLGAERLQAELEDLAGRAGFRVTGPETSEEPVLDLT
ncbi:MAG: ATP-binding protein, partial [Nitriliruptoraceae bacterium]